MTSLPMPSRPSRRSDALPSVFPFAVGHCNGSGVIRLADGNVRERRRNVACDSFDFPTRREVMEQALRARNYWIGVVSKSHVDKAVAGGFTQLNHGKAGPLERMREGDGFAFYSPRIEHPYGAPLQVPGHGPGGPR